MVDLWEPLLSSCIVSITIGVTGMIILCKGTQRPRKMHMMNVFNQQAFALLFMAFFVRSFLWVVWVNPGDLTNIPSGGDDKADSNVGISISFRAFLLTYPSMNILICAFLIQYPWLYDFILIQNGRRINLILRQQMKTFVVATNIFTLLMYLVYAFAFPIKSDDYGGKLFELY